MVVNQSGVTHNNIDDGKLPEIQQTRDISQYTVNNIIIHNY